MTTSRLTGYVLVVDDSSTTRNVLMRRLTDMGCTVEGACDGAEALNKILFENYDLVLLDLEMPALSGFEVLNILKERELLSDQRVIVISSNEEVSMAAQCIMLGADDYITKPFDPILLHARVVSSLERKRLRDHEKSLVSELNEALEDSKRVQVQLIRQSQMVVLGRLTAGIAHEMNNPIGAVSSAAGQLRDGLSKLWRSTSAHDEALAIFFEDLIASKDNSPILSTSELRELRPRIQAEFPEFTPAQHEALARLNPLTREKMKKLTPEALELAWLALHFSDIARTLAISADRVTRVVKSLGSYSRPDHDQFSQVDIAQGLEDILLVFGHQLRNVSVERRYAKVPPVPGRPGQLNQVWSNLISNGLQAMKFDGELLVGLDCQGNGVLVTIQDSGKGISAEDLPRIFDMNFTRRSGGDFGLGMGLTIVKEIVEAHGGRVEVESRPGQTRFSIFIPGNEAST
jgi:two-component system, NtrC family, sensor kinase